MKLIITIDAEEDNWGEYNPTGNTCENIKRIPALQQLFDDFQVRPTYLVTYPVATDEESTSIFRRILEEGKCEIGTHCHPWNTPPYKGEDAIKYKMLCNLPIELQYQKISFIHDTIEKYFEIRPVSFRSGRWAYSQNVAINLYKIGYKIDTSVTPYIDWKSSNGPDFSNISPQPFKFSPEDILHKSSNGRMIEVPVTIGFIQSNFTVSNYISRALRQKLLKPLRLSGLLYRLNLLNKVWLSPEKSNARNMIKLTQCMMQNNYRFINMFFHSSSLKAGLTPFVKTRDDETKFYQNLREFLTFARDTGIESIRLRDMVDII